MGEKIRAHAIISGRVQGVCYRMETQRAAQRNGVVGWVKNKKDGTVEAVFEGDKQDIDSVLSWCHKGPRLADVAGIDVEWESFTGDYSSFDITY